MRGPLRASGVDLDPLRDDQVIDDFHFLAFPNLVFNAHSEMHTRVPCSARCGAARARSTSSSSTTDRHRRRRARSRPGEGARSITSTIPEGARVTEVLDQDLDGIGRVHAGLRSAGIDHVVFADFECRLTAMHTELDRYLGDLA